MSTLGAVLIVRNEEDLLPRCLESLRRFDEVVVLDTGSTDRTMDLARQSGARVHEARFDPFHFGDARNKASEHASADWLLSIDADEVLMPGAVHVLRRVLSQTDRTGFQVRFKYHEDAPLAYKFKLWKRGCYTWKYRVHNQLVPVEGAPWKLGFIPEVVIEHHPKKEKRDRRAQTFELLQAAVKETPGHWGAWRALALELAERKEWDGSLRAFDRYFELADDEPLDRSEMLIKAGQCLAAGGHIEKALERFEEAARTAPMRREPLYQAAMELLELVKTDGSCLFEAERWLARAVAIPVSSRPEFWLNHEEVWGNLPQEALNRCRQDIAALKALWSSRSTP